MRDGPCMVVCYWMFVLVSVADVVFVVCLGGVSKERGFVHGRWGISNNIPACTAQLAGHASSQSHPPKT